MLKIRNIKKKYENLPLLDGISLTIERAECICLLGPSGSGKSTLLRIIAGLENLDDGEVFWDEGDLKSVPPHKRDFGLVFQDYALFPHLDVKSNIAFGMRMKKWDLDKIDHRLIEVMDLVNLDGFGSRNVTDLSGGEQQRVALARALAPYPRMLMFDEPLGALDRSLSQVLLDELRSILRKSKVPALYVTHDQDEAFTIADRILILHDGKIVQEGKPEELVQHPGSAWIANFLDVGTVVLGNTRARGVFTTSVGDFKVSCNHDHRQTESASLLIRPEAASDALNLLRGRVRDVIFQREKYKVVLDNGVFLYLNSPPAVGSPIETRVNVECLGA
jgi:ABC-type Fe3+/spermidine/putrescine transport system ATPase subunit